MLTRRIVIFKGREGWFSTREFVGDRRELEAIHSQDTCEATWKSISRAFQGVKTLQEFQTTASWAEHLYHSAVESPQEDPPSLPDDMPLLAARGLEKDPDEILVVYQDLGATGIRSFCRCPSCGRAYPITYDVDGKVSFSTALCLSCGTPVDWSEPMPSEEAWQTALKMYKEPPATYKIKDDMVHNQIAREHAGHPVKLLKIIGFESNKMTFEAQFRDRKTALVYPSELAPCETPAK